ncbi:MAG: CPBP family glutamic-type intramembrane protease [Candidatus Omnitrophota bacterium]|nr:CPBP family glutamic-type intramembrane protease [Candidatus Omnitrophota bacterium]MDZ4241360.1 CPBP family glutamic-type intramembrane protease [Candidatus Omnitrophota bacterium]
MSNGVIAAVLAVLLYCDVSLLWKQSPEILRRFCALPMRYGAAYVFFLVVLTLVTGMAQNALGIFLFFIFIPYLIYRVMFKLALRRAPGLLASMPLDLRMASDGFTVLYLWMSGMVALVMLLQAAKAVLPGPPSELAEMVVTAVLSFAGIIGLIALRARRYPGVSFTQITALRKGDASWKKILVLPALAGTGFAVLTSVWILARDMQPQTPLNKAIEAAPSAGIFYLFLVMAVFIAPFAEEVIFRGYFFYVIRQYRGTALAVGIVSAVFALLHVEQYWGDWFAIFMVGVLGVILALLRVWAGTTLASTVAHYFYNGMMTLIPVLTLIVSNPTYYQYQTRFPQLTSAEKEGLLTESLRRQPGHADSCNDLAWLYAEEGRNLDEALRLIDLALAGSPRKYAYRDTKAEVLYKMGRTEEAVMLGEELAADYPDDEYARKQLEKFRAARQPVEPGG